MDKSADFPPSNKEKDQKHSSTIIWKQFWFGLIILLSFGKMKLAANTRLARNATQLGTTLSTSHFQVTCPQSEVARIIFLGRPLSRMLLVSLANNVPMSLYLFPHSFCPTDQKYATCSDDGTVRVWDFLRCHEERILRGWCACPLLLCLGDQGSLLSQGGEPTDGTTVMSHPRLEDACRVPRYS